MPYNIHPILVHFPVALLFIYSVIKIVPLRKWFPLVVWRDIERAFLFFGVLGAFVALATGEMAENVTHPSEKLVEAHSAFAVVSTLLYCLLLLGEIISVLYIKYPYFIKNEKLKKLLTKIEYYFCNHFFSKVLAFLGLVAISITGMLGGVMVRGLSADPLVPFVLKILGISL